MVYKCVLENELWNIDNVYRHGSKSTIYAGAQLIISTVKKTHYIKKKSCQNLEIDLSNTNVLYVKIIKSLWRINALVWQVLFMILNFIQFPKIQNIKVF
jgi:hypothetical protein